jgi:hypothetical protein
MAARGSGLTQKELMLEMRTDIRDLSVKLDTVVVNHGERISATEAELRTYKGDRKWALGVVAALAILWLTAMIATLPGCTTVTPPGATVVAMTTHEVAFTATLTSSPTYAPTETPVATLTPTVDWSSTPTPGDYATQSWIYEVTPLGGTPWSDLPSIEKLSGVYTPNGNQNVRNGPGIDRTVSYRVPAGQKIIIVAWLSSLPDEAWLCLDAGCSKAVALVYEGKELGELIIDD